MKQTEFSPVKDPKVVETKGKIIKVLKQCTETTSFQNIFRWWVKTMAITIQNNCRLKGSERWNALEQEYLAIVKTVGENTIRKFSEAFALYMLLLEVCPFADWLGCIYMELVSQGEKGQFFTPFHVSQVCAKMVWSDADAESDEPMTLNEPTCGSGGMVVAWIEHLHSKGIDWQRRARVTCGDIDECCVHMSYVTLSLLGVRATVLHQNALSLETWSIWHTPAEMFGAAMFLKPTHADAAGITPEPPQIEPEPQKTVEPIVDTPKPENVEKRDSKPVQRSLF